MAPGNGFGDAGMNQIRWALTNVADNGWIGDCCLTDPSQPLTHTLGYALRGIVEGYRYSQDETYLGAARKIAAGLAGNVSEDGFLAGQFDSSWSATVSWCCLTGSVQIAASLIDLYEWTGEEHWLQTARSLIRYVRSTVATTGNIDTVGAIAGSYPIDGTYGQYEYLNWAAKFFIDAQLMELKYA